MTRSQFRLFFGENAKGRPPEMMRYYRFHELRHLLQSGSRKRRLQRLPLKRAATTIAG